MAGIYDKPIDYKVMNTYVPLPFEQIRSMAQPYQQQSDTLAAASQEMKYAYAKVPFLEQHRNAWEAKNKEAEDNFTKLYESGKYDMNQMQNDFYGLTAKTKNDPIIADIAKDYKIVTESAAKLEEAKRKGDTMQHNVKDAEIGVWDNSTGTWKKTGATTGYNYDKYINDEAINKTVSSSLSDISKGFGWSKLKPDEIAKYGDKILFRNSSGKSLTFEQVKSALDEAGYDPEILRELNQRAAAYPKSYRTSDGKIRRATGEDLYEQAKNAVAAGKVWKDVDNNFQFIDDGSGSGSGRISKGFETNSVPTVTTPTETVALKTIADTKRTADIKEANARNAYATNPNADTKRAYELAKNEKEQATAIREKLVQNPQMDWDNTVKQYKEKYKQDFDKTLAVYKKGAGVNKEAADTYTTLKNEFSKLSIPQQKLFIEHMDDLNFSKNMSKYFDNEADAKNMLQGMKNFFAPISGFIDATNLQAIRKTQKNLLLKDLKANIGKKEFISEVVGDSRLELFKHNTANYAEGNTADNMFKTKQSLLEKDVTDNYQESTRASILIPSSGSPADNYLKDFFGKNDVTTIGELTSTDVLGNTKKEDVDLEDVRKAAKKDKHIYMSNQLGENGEIIFGASLKDEKEPRWFKISNQNIETLKSKIALPSLQDYEKTGNIKSYNDAAQIYGSTAAVLDDGTATGTFGKEVRAYNKIYGKLKESEELPIDTPFGRGTIKNVGKTPGEKLQLSVPINGQMYDIPAYASGKSGNTEAELSIILGSFLIDNQKI